MLYCIYHSRDLDGFASGAIVKRQYPDTILVGYDYGQPNPDIPFDGNECIMVDVSFPIDTMFEIAGRCQKFTWIDHHISAIKEYETKIERAPDNMEVILQNGIAACELTWMHFNPGDAIPLAINWLGIYDTWRQNDANYDWESVILPFQYGMRSICNSPETFPKSLFNVRLYPTKIITDGEAILRYMHSANELLCRKGAFEFVLGDMKVIALNVSGASSDTFRSVYDQNKHDLMMPFYFDGRRWIFSIYTTHDNIDCSRLAKSFGGGGHAKAAGFEAKELRDIIPNIYEL